MLKIDKLFEVLDEFAPIELSHKLIEQGDFEGIRASAEKYVKIARNFAK